VQLLAQENELRRCRCGAAGNFSVRPDTSQRFESTIRIAVMLFGKLRKKTTTCRQAPPPTVESSKLRIATA
jgi:hypothetical protein